MCGKTKRDVLLYPTYACAKYTIYVYRAPDKILVERVLFYLGIASTGSEGTLSLKILSSNLVTAVVVYNFTFRFHV